MERRPGPHASPSAPAPDAGRIARLRAKLAEVGVGYAVQIGLARCVPVGWLRFGRLVVLAIEAADGPAPEAPPGAELRFADARDLSLLRAFGHSAETLQGRLARGDKPFVMVSGGELIGYAWFRSGVYDEESLGVRFSMADDEAWLYDAMVARARRGRGLYTQLLRAAREALRREGVRRVWVVVEALNRNSVEAHRRGGAVPVCTIGLLRILGITRLFAPTPPGVRRWSVGRWPEIPSNALGDAGPGARRRPL